MEAKISKAQTEVWEWKEKAYNQIMHLPKSERIQFILLQTKEMVDRIKKNKPAPQRVQHTGQPG